MQFIIIDAIIDYEQQTRDHQLLKDLKYRSYRTLWDFIGSYGTLWDIIGPNMTL